MIRSNLLAAAVAAMVALGLAACAGAEGADRTAADPTSGGADAVADACLEGEPDCVDTPQLTEREPVPIDETGIEQLRRDARYYLGVPQDELPEVVRIARTGDEDVALTEDYQIGRITVELDDHDGDGTPVVTSATVELPDGPETFELDG